jgi:hypothetical protein
MADAEIPPDLLARVESLATRVHEAWMELKIAEGYRLGPLDAASKTHPMLVAYDALSEHDKDADRATVLATIMAMLREGFKIIAPAPDEPLNP